ncbi:MAG: hypothetical protein AB7G11_01875 [Phycisphaerales bacterium]
MKKRACLLRCGRRGSRALAFAAGAVLLGALAGISAGPRAQPVDPPTLQPAEPASTSAGPDAARTWSAPLSALAPEQPIGYFLLAEEVASEAGDVESVNLARRLFVLAYELNQRADVATRVPTLPTSVCLALASIATRDDERRWLLALAQSFSEPLGFGPADASAAPTAPREAPVDIRLDAASVLGLCRAGDARRAETLLEKPGVYDLLRQVDVSRGTMFSIESFIERSRRDWPVCPQCRNRRAVPSGGKNGQMTLCDTCRGTPGVRLTDVELIYQLRVESALLAGTQRSWAAQLFTDGGAPLRDLDAGDLAATYDVDAAKPFWRQGTWTSTR